jgi:hypothetical protein
MPSGVYKRSEESLVRIRNLRVGKMPWNIGKPWAETTKDLISKRKKERDKQTKKSYLDWLISGKVGKIPSMPGKKRASNGKTYHRVLNKDGKDYPEHRLMVELVINRKLKCNEIVHHVNGLIQDNRFENLCLFEKEKYHLAYHNGWLKKYNLKPSLESLQEYIQSVNLTLIKVVVGQVKSLLIVRETLTV